MTRQDFLHELRYCIRVAETGTDEVGYSKRARADYLHVQAINAKRLHENRIAQVLDNAAVLVIAGNITEASNSIAIEWGDFKVEPCKRCKELESALRTLHDSSFHAASCASIKRGAGCDCGYEKALGIVTPLLD